MIFNTPSNRSIREVLADKAGNSLPEALGAVALIMIATMTLSMGISTNMSAVQTIATKAERQAAVSALVGDKREGATWGSPDAPSTEKVVLKNGREVDVTMWREAGPVGTTLTAVTAISAGPDAADCTGPSDIAKTGCVYATRFHAGDMSSVEPAAIIRKDPSLGAAAPVGTVDARVATSDSIPQGTEFATGSDTSTVVMRYLLTANSVEATGEVRLMQAGKVLAIIPVDSDPGNYFGTFTVTPNVPVTAIVSQGNIVVQTIYIYRAGGTA